MLRADPIAPSSYDLQQEPLNPDERDSIDTDAIIRFIRRRRRLCLFWLAAGLCAGIAYAILTPAYYTAFASILLEDQAARSSDSSVSATDAANSTYVETQVQVLESEEVVGRVVDEGHLTEDEEFGGAAGGLRSLLRYVRSLLGSGSATATREPRYATIVRLQHGLAVQRVGTSDVVEIRFTSRSSIRSAAIANAIIKSYIDGRLVMQRKAHEASLSHLWERLAELRDKAFPIDPPQDAPAGASESGPQARARFREQQDKTATYRALYDRLLQSAYGDSDGQSASVNVRVLTPAEPPLIPSSQVTLVLALTSVGGVAGIGHALLRELTDDCLRTVEDVQRSTKIDRVAAVPVVKTQAWTTEESLSAYLQPAYLKVSGLLYDAMAKLAVRLQDGRIRRTGWIIGIAAPIDGTGVSSIALHLARIMAESGQKTLLLDANWRKHPTGQALLNSSEGRKLARGLGNIQLGAESLDVLVLRATAPISELNASLSIVSTLELLRADYECIVIDFHSGEQTADLEACIRVIDEVILVAEARRVTSGSLCGFLRELPGNKIAAVILNKI